MRINLLFFFLFIQTNVQAQYNQQDILLGQNGQDLIDNLVLQYKPLIILEYDQARDTMFAEIYTIQDSVSCVYTGHTLYLTPGLDPSTVLHSGGSGLGINTEHTFPQSKGAGDGNARSDMHHLFPVRAAANSARNNFPYEEIENSETTSWYYRDLTESTPSLDPRLYGKLNILKPAFEPQESHKGNAARAVFYFYTMYKAEADQADPTFFAGQVATLCQWHLDDPVDSLEWERTYLIADYQEGKANPFVLDCSLPYRTYCPHLPHNSCYTSLNTLADLGVELYHPFPNPAKQSTMVQYELDRSTYVKAMLYNNLGQLIKVFINEEASAGFYQYELDCSDLNNGVYTYQLQFEQAGKELNIAKTFIVKH